MILCASAAFELAEPAATEHSGTLDAADGSAHSPTVLMQLASQSAAPERIVNSKSPLLPKPGAGLNPRRLALHMRSSHISKPAWQVHRLNAIGMFEECSRCSKHGASLSALEQRQRCIVPHCH